MDVRHQQLMPTFARKQDMGAGVRCMVRVKERLWVGLACGGVHVFTCGTKPKLLAHWVAHDCAVIAFVQVPNLLGENSYQM